MSGPLARVFVVGGLQCIDFFAGQEGEVFEVADHVAVVCVDPELVEAVDARLGRIEPDGAFLGLAELGAVRVCDERQGQSPDVSGKLFAGEVDAGGDVAPLVAPADL